MTTSDKKIQQIKNYRSQGWPIRAIAAKLKISEGAAFKYSKQYPKINLPGRISFPQRMTTDFSLVQRAPSELVYYSPQRQGEPISPERPVYNQPGYYYPDQNPWWNEAQQRRQQAERRQQDESQKKREHEERMAQIRRDGELLQRQKQQQEEQSEKNRLLRKIEQNIRYNNQLKESIQKLQLEGEKSRQKPVQRETPVLREATQPTASSPLPLIEKQKNNTIIQKETVAEEKQTRTPSENKPDPGSKPRITNHGTTPQNRSTDTQLDIEPILWGLLKATPKIIETYRNIQEALQTGVYPGLPTGGQSKNEDVQNIE